jgi:pimeloyl-ACP methyl ester carboxylesterase
VANEVLFEVEGGSLAALDHGGSGQPVLLVHGSGHNAAAWALVAAGLLPDHRVVAVDLRGHGHSSAGSTTAEQYWRDLAAVVAALGWDRPLLVGHSTGGYAVTAITAAGLTHPAGICVVDGLVLDDRPTAARALAGFRTQQAADDLRRTFGYGRRFDTTQRDAWIDEQVASAATDWLNAGSDPELVRAVAARGFLTDADGALVRRPSLEEIVTTTNVAVDAPVYPSRDVYDRITCPMTVVLPDQGFYAPRGDEVAGIVAAAPNRRLVTISAGHNVVMTHPEPLVAAIRTMVTCPSKWGTDHVTERV